LSFQTPPGQTAYAERFADGKYLFKTWTGRIILLCSAIYIPMALLTGSVLSTSPSFFNLLYFLGAKETVAIAEGQWWRLINPIFLHFNLIHFLLNMAALKFIGRIVERNVGSFWFLSIFMISGIQGNLWSSLGHTALGAGASGAIFGLIGTMILIEYAAEWQRVKASREVKISGDIIDIVDEGTKKFKIVPGPFTVMGLLNIALAIAINTIASFSGSTSFGIDNAAHLGGLTAGLILGLAFLCMHNTRLMKRNAPLGRTIFCVVLFAGGFQALYLYKSTHLKNLLMKEAIAEPELQRSYHLFERALRVSPDDTTVHFHLGKLLVMSGNLQEARKHLQFAAQSHNMKESFDALENQLLLEKNMIALEWIRLIRTEARGTPL